MCIYMKKKIQDELPLVNVVVDMNQLEQLMNKYNAVHINFSVASYLTTTLVNANSCNPYANYATLQS